MSDSPEDPAGNLQNNALTRRRLIRAAGLAGGAALVPQRWVKPLIESVVVPLHAQASGCTTQLTLGGLVNWGLDNSEHRIVVQITAGLGDTASGDAFPDPGTGAFSGTLAQAGGTCPGGGALTQSGSFSGTMNTTTGALSGIFGLEVRCGGALFCVASGSFSGTALFEQIDVPLSLSDVTQDCCDP